ncbi:MAG: hypothetical protein HPY71_00535 [Firmicutes bacterium]|nr:hypothetical protein [Bacillota bacterium]
MRKGVAVPASTEAEVRRFLIPAKVEMQVSPSSTVIAFGNAQIRIAGELLKSSGAGRGAENVIRDFIQRYCEFLTGEHDKYAKVFTQLHRLREITLDPWLCA